MANKEIEERLKELAHLYAEHAENQSEEDYKRKNKLRPQLLDLFLALKPHIKKLTKLQWYDPAYNYAITGNLDYIKSVRDDLAHMIGQYSNEA